MSVVRHAVPLRIKETGGGWAERKFRKIRWTPCLPDRTIHWTGWLKITIRETKTMETMKMLKTFLTETIWVEIMTTVYAFALYSCNFISKVELVVAINKKIQILINFFSSKKLSLFVKDKYCTDSQLSDLQYDFLLLMLLFGIGLMYISSWTI